ncbi:TPA: hypothetical protein J1Z11_003512 [Escherichia coli]|nr:hypothetical protein [Escherichia coli]
MDGFLKGKCIPRDLKVNETNAEYLVRKFAEAEAKISALSEDHQKAIESIKQADAIIVAIENEQERLFDEDYLMDSKECIDVIREEVKRWNDSSAAGIRIKGE